MSAVNYPNAQSTLSLNGYTFQHLMEGEALNLAPVNEKTSRTNAMNGGVSVSNRIDGDVHDLTIVVQKHSPDDKFLNDNKNSDSPTLFNGSMKRAYNEGGSTKKTTTSLDNGTITTQPGNVDNNQDADNTKTYVIQFRTAKETF